MRWPTTIPNAGNSGSYRPPQPQQTTPAPQQASDAALSGGYGTTYYTYKADVVLRPGQKVGFTPGRGYYAYYPLAQTSTPMSTGDQTRALSGAGKKTPDLFIPLGALVQSVKAPPRLPEQLEKHAEILRHAKIVTAKGTFEIVNPRLTVLAAGITALPLPLALGLLTQESSGGQNIWGEDPGRNFAGGIAQTSTGTKNWGNIVTEAGYSAYKSQIGTGGAQGVGPTMLTLPELQEYADKAGGAWKPFPNLLVGFDYLANLVWTKSDNLHDALNMYNAGHAIPATPGDYASVVLGYANQWAKALGMPSNPNLWSA